MLRLLKPAFRIENRDKDIPAEVECVKHFLLQENAKSHNWIKKLYLKLG